MPESSDNTNDSRFVAMLQWFEQQKPAIATYFDVAQVASGEFASASSDASFRRYFRWSSGELRLIVMDAPPTHENCEPFVRIAEHFLQAALHAPVVIAKDLAQGFLLLSDLGAQTWLEYWQAAPENIKQAEQMFPLALSALIQMQKIDAVQAGLPAYDEALLRRELELFPHWYVQHELGVEFSAQQQAWWDVASQRLINAALAQKRVFVHRDFMPRNLMRSKPNPGLIDFQDAVSGPVSYDVTSLFKDAFISWPHAQVDAWLEQYWTQARQQGIGVPHNLTDFRRDCDWMGLQRHLKVIGIFARIWHRDGKPRYLADVPRFFNYIEPVLERYPELYELRCLLDSLPARRACP